MLSCPGDMNQNSRSFTHMRNTFVCSLVGLFWHLLTHSDLPVQDISGDVDSSHGLTTKHKLGSGLEDPGVRAQMTFTLFFLQNKLRRRRNH